MSSQEDFLCPICLDVFTHPVTTPCGHNFCKSCINAHWDRAEPASKCPVCNEVFEVRPELCTNTLISELVAERLRQEVHREQQGLKPGEVPCDVCTETKRKALKSCLVCLMSLCETHLEPHLQNPRLRGHQLVEPLDDLEDRMCKEHDKPLELFCRTDQACICMLCSVLAHKNHQFVPLKQESSRKKVEVQKMEAEIQQMVQERQAKIQEIRSSVKASDEDADRQKAEGVEVFSALKDSVDRSLREFLKDIEDKQKHSQKQAKDLITKLEEEISELTETRAEAQKLRLSEDHHLLLKSFPSLKAPPTKDWTEVPVRPVSYEGTVLRAVSQLEKKFREDMQKLEEVELKRIRRFAVDVTLDPETSHPKLILSGDGKQVYNGGVSRDVPENPKRFDLCVMVLGKESFSSGRAYFEVQVKEKTDWSLGVAKESINRKGPITLTPENGFWVLIMRNGNKYKACCSTPVVLSLRSRPEKVGVLVDYDEGLVSFHDADTAALIYSFTGCSLTEKLCPYLCPSLSFDGKNSAPLIICPVNQTEATNN